MREGNDMARGADSSHLVSCLKAGCVQAGDSRDPSSLFFVAYFLVFLSCNTSCISPYCCLRDAAGSAFHSGTGHDNGRIRTTSVRLLTALNRSRVLGPSERHLS